MPEPFNLADRLTPKQAADMRKEIGDPSWRLCNFYKIQTKRKTLENFKLNPIQRRIHNESSGHNRIMHLKARQEGVSTYWLIRELDECLFTPHTTTAVLAHDRDTLEVLFEIVSRAYNNIPSYPISDSGFEWVKPHADRSSTRMLKFDDIDSKIYVDLSVRGGTIHNLHISESAFIKNMSEVWAATQEAVPVHGGRIVVESTANGKGNWYHEQWSSENTWFKMFFAWFDNPENAVDFPKDGPLWQYSCDAVERSMTSTEKQMMAEYGLTIPQIAWYRYKIDSYGEAERHLMRQENPSNADEAFIFAEGRFYPEFSKTVHVVPNLKDDRPPPGVNKYCSLDYGWSNPSCICFFYGDYDENYILYKEAYKSFWPIPEQCNYLRAHGFSRVDFCDPSMFAKTQQREGRIESIADEYRRGGITLHRANNDKGAGVPRVRDYLRVRDKHQNPFNRATPAPHLYFCEGCTESIREFESIRYAKASGASAVDQTAKEDHEKSGTISHAADAVRYFIVSRPRLPERTTEIIPGTPAFRIKQWEERNSAVTTY